MGMPKISVIIPSYNSAATIKACLESVLATHYPNLEIVVVDDVSTDDSPRIVESMSRGIRLVRQEKNSGPACARNRGAREALGEYLFFLDSDTQMLPESLNAFVQHMHKADAVTGIYDKEPLNRGIVARYKALLNYYFFSRNRVIPYEVFDASRAGIRKSIFIDMGGFNEQLAWGMDYENEEFGYRLVKRYRNILVPAVCVRHVFPGFRQLTKDYFLRVSLWMELFMKRRKFESGGVTGAGTGLSTAALLMAVGCGLGGFVVPGLWFLGAVAFLIYVVGYAGFFVFVLRDRPTFFLAALICNMYFTAVIAAGAVRGLLKAAVSR